MIELADVYLLKAEQSLEGAQSELLNGRHDNAANRSYYACFQAAVAALIRGNVSPPRRRGRRDEWGHDFVQAQFVGQLLNRRKVYPSDLRQTLARNYSLRQTADYGVGLVSQVEASRAVRRAREFVEAISERGGGVK